MVEILSAATSHLHSRMLRLEEAQMGLTAPMQSAHAALPGTFRSCWIHAGSCASCSVLAPPPATLRATGEEGVGGAQRKVTKRSDRAAASVRGAGKGARGHDRAGAAAAPAAAAAAAVVVVVVAAVHALDLFLILGGDRLDGGRVDRQRDGLSPRRAVALG
eukprot:COSAG01_NODE_11631_length_1892_cov_2.068042_2_plen_161_part_00